MSLTNTPPMKKAVALISGGLDSLLAAKVIKDLGVHVEGINFYSGFFGMGSSMPSSNKKKDVTKNAAWVAEQVGIKLHVIDVFEEFKETLVNPRYGYGKNINPCLDCKVFIVKKAMEWAKKNDFDFVISGEVMGQRPMSQRKNTMPIVAKRSGADDLLLRPLSAKLLPITKPEREGWVDREKLYGFSGRDRKPQIALAKKLGFHDFPQPAGGCLLTEIHFCARLKDFWAHRPVKSDYTKADIDLLKIGRHLRINDHFKLIIGRDQVDNECLEKYTQTMTNLFCKDHNGPLVLIDGDVSEDELELAANITAYFGKGKNEACVVLNVCRPGVEVVEKEIMPSEQFTVDKGWYIA